jgi:putative heme iron utilization protein
MSVEEASKGPSFSPVKETALTARAMVRAAQKGSLATLMAQSGHPYASLLLTATELDGSPVFLISKLALHTKNLIGDARASLLIDATGTEVDPMQGSRITLIGSAQPTTSATARRRFLARHPAAGYADFPDFSFYAFNVESAHFIGGFGRIFDLDPGGLLLPLAGAESLVEGEPGIVAHMNEDHADAIELYATALGDAGPGAWRMAGIDPEGFDIVLDGQARRILFAQPIATPAEARTELVRLAAESRAGRQ